MKILLHQCCAPCSIYPVGRLLSDGISVHGFFYNPNIHPYTEYKKRLDTLKEFNSSAGIEYTVQDIYGLRGFLDMAAKNSGRCEGCYMMRLELTAKTASEKGFDAFTSTLLYSRRQKHDQIKSVAEECARRYNVGFLYEDYRKGWQTGIDRSKSAGMYRQNYCGCIFSEEERYLGSK